MTTPLLITIAVLLALLVVLQICSLLRKPTLPRDSLQEALEPIQKAYERIERAVRDEIANNRAEVMTSSGQLRQEVTAALTSNGQHLGQHLANLTSTNDDKLERLRSTVEKQLQLIQSETTAKLDQARTEANLSAQKDREELTAGLKTFGETATNVLNTIGKNQDGQLGQVVDHLAKLADSTEKKLESQRNSIDERLKQIQTDNSVVAKQLREEVGITLKNFNDSVLKGVATMAESQQQRLAAFSEQLGKLIDSNQQKLDGLKTAVEDSLKSILVNNEKQLDQMRATVDEKLQGTLEKRLGESFKLVSDRLEQVYRGLGEMQTLATGVGDLKKVLTNVKTRGTWGEIQLGAMLEQILSPDQYAKNVATKDAGERVEFAIKLPGRGDEKSEIVWLPIDAKFPVEDYQRLVEAQERADAEAAESAAKQLENRVRQCAQDICDKYIGPPRTTDFGILYLPTEGLFAEVIRRIGLPESIQRDCRVVIAGPTTLWSILNSLQMGFRTLAIEKRSSEVWKVLGAVKAEFGKFGDLLDGLKKKLDQASNTIDDAARKSRTIQRKLRDVQELPAAEAATMLMIAEATDESADGESSD